MQYTLEQFKKDVIKWSADRLIVQNGSITGQLQKVREECAEVSAEIAKIIEGNGCIDDLEKELGDIAVLLINIDFMQGSDSIYYFPEIKGPIDDYNEALMSLGEIFKSTVYTDNDYDYAWRRLLDCCESCSLDISVCAYKAFKKIEHRKGYFCKEVMSFVKEAE